MKNVIASTLILASMTLSASAQRGPIGGGAPPAAADRPKIDVESYAIELTLSPEKNEIRGIVDVRFRQLERMSYATFDLDSRFEVDSVMMDGTEIRYRQFDFDSTLDVTLGMTTTDTVAVRFEYGGFIDPEGSGRAPSLVTLSENGALLLYEGKWFPTNGLFRDKATATLKVNTPEGWSVITDLPASPDGAAGFGSSTPSYWGMVAAGKYTTTGVKAGSGDVSVHTLAASAADVQPIAETAGKMMDFYRQTFGPLASQEFKIVEAAGANWPSRWAPGVLLMPATQFRADFDAAALGRAVAHQWFPLKVSVADPAGDAWMVDGLAVFASLLYAEKNLSPAAAQEQIDKTLVRALSNENEIGIREAGELNRETPNYRALVENKGAFVFRMLQWLVGEDKFNQILMRYLEQFQSTPASTSAFIKLSSDVAGQDLEYFFDQWLNDPGVPEMTTEWTVRRVKTGYTVDGDIRQDLDLFRMPVELEIETDGEPEYKRVEVSGEASQFLVDTERKPRAVNIDPRKKILRMSPDIKVAVAINRGEEFMNEGRFADARDQFQDAIDMDGRSSLASFRMGEALFEMSNLPTAVMNFRNALSGDLKPKWVEVWSYINLGKIYDIRGDHDRAVAEYQKAIATGDDAYGALADARKYIETPFRRSQRQD